jgi:hypothetical protein
MYRPNTNVNVNDNYTAVIFSGNITLQYFVRICVTDINCVGSMGG